MRHLTAGKRIARWIPLPTLIVFAVLAVLVAGCGGDGDEAAPTGEGEGEDLGTIEPGVITVGIRGDLPFAAEKDGSLTGVDGDIMSALAEKLGQDIRIETMDFSGQLGAVASGRIDVAIGSIGWQKERVGDGIFTDPTYYAGATVVQPEGAGLETLSDLEGATIGTVTGYAWVPAIEQLPGAELQTYETADAVYLDLAAGRIDAAFVDTIQDTYTAGVRPELEMEAVPLEVSDAELSQHPAYSVFGQVQFPFYLPKSHKELEDALTKEIRGMYESGELAAILEDWELDPQRLLVPDAEEAAAERVGVDRPQDWEPPSIEPPEG